MQRIHLVLVLILSLVSLVGFTEHQATAEDGNTGETYLPLVASGNAYYLSPSGNDAAAGTKPTSAWATFERAWDALYPGDTLILLDGVYHQTLHPQRRNGQPGKPITIRALNDGQATIDGDGVRAPVILGEAWPGPVGDWYVLEGVVARNADNVPDDDGRFDGGGSVIHLSGSHNVLRRVSAYDASTDGNSAIITFDFRGSYNTVEDCVAAGTGRKAIMIYNSTHNVVRRCVAMATGWNGRLANQHWPWGENIDIYNSSDNLIENSISLGYVSKYGITIRANSSKVEANNNRILGSMALLSGRNLQGDYLDRSCPRPLPSLNDTCVDYEEDGYRVGLKFYGAGQMDGNTVRDLLVTQNASYGVSLGGGSHPTNTVLDHVSVFDNDHSMLPEDVATLKTDSNQLVDSYIAGANQQGAGARLERRYVDGVLTGAPLWPWSMEGRIQQELGISITDLISQHMNRNVPSALAQRDYKPVRNDDASSLPLVNVPHVADEKGSAVFWMGKVTPQQNYADVRVYHDDEYLSLTAHIIDRSLWYDRSPDRDTLSEWDAVSLYLLPSTAAGTIDGAFRFDAQVNHWQPREDYQAAYLGQAGAWSQTDVPFSSESGWRADDFFNTSARGWRVKFSIPFSSLGLSSPPAQGTRWRFAVVIHDRDGEAAETVTSTNWPAEMAPTLPASWATLHFGYPVRPSLSFLPTGLTTIRDGLVGSQVEDAHVGGHTTCGADVAPDFFTAWGETNYAGYGQINIQNQWDIADWPCFSKFYVKFPLDRIPPGKEIVAATLTLYQFGNAWGEGVTSSWIQVGTVAPAWDESTLTWNNAPSLIENLSGTWVQPLREKPEWPGVAANWDVTGAVSEAYRAGAPLSLALYSSDGAYHSGKYFSSSDTGDWNDKARPTLLVLWGDPGAPGYAQFMSFILR